MGGCPFAGSATGNLATEDLVFQLHGLGIETGIDLPALVRTSNWMADQLVPLPATFALVGDTPDKIRGWGR